MQCKGKCHLKDALAQTSSPDNKTVPNLEVHVQFPVFISETADFQNILVWRKGITCIYDNEISSVFVNRIFHPPPMA